jgi:hypothetical protein
MAYLDGELTSEAADKAAEHLRECRECQELAADLQSISRRMTEWQVAAGEPQMTPAMVTALQEHETKFAHGSTHSKPFWRDLFGAFRIPRWAWASAGAALVLLVATGIWTTQRNLAVRQQSTMLGQQQTGETLSVRSADSAVRPQSSEGGDRDRLRAVQAQVGSSMARNSTLAAPAALPRDAATASNNAGSAATATYAAANKPMIARTAQLTILVKDFDASQTRLQEILKRHGGYVGEMTTSAPEGADRRLSATLRVPADQLDAAIAEVKQLGRVESESQSGEEVTSQYIDLQARLTNARNTELRLTELLRRQTGKLDEVVTVEEKVSDVREQIERMEAEQKNLSQRVDFGTLSVSFSEEHKSQLQVMPPSVGTQFHNAAVEGYRSVADGIVSLLVFLMSWGPSLLIWAAVLFFPVRLVWRRLHREAA